MHEQPLSPLSLDVCELLDSCIDSVDALDALLLLLPDPSRWWSVPELAREIDVNVDGAKSALDALRARGLAADAASSTLFRLASLDSYSHAAFNALARACATERNAVVEHVARRSMARMRVLAEAFTRARGAQTLTLRARLAVNGAKRALVDAARLRWQERVSMRIALIRETTRSPT